MATSPAHLLSHSHLSRLVQIRFLLLAALWLSTAVGGLADWLGQSGLSLFSLLIAFSIYQLACVARLKSQLPVVQIEYFVQLLIDVFFLIGLFYFSGGATNPFISYLLVPICISAATLPWRFTWVVAGLCVIAYSLLLFWNLPLPLFAMDHSQPHSPLSWHIWGMWINFFVSAVLITYYVVQMATTIRQQELSIAQLREEELRHEQVIAVATLAAGAAHEINTPLATMKLLLSELEIEYKNQPHLAGDLQLLKQQVEHCAGVLKQLVSNSQEQVQGIVRAQPFSGYLQSILDRWQLLRPQVQFQVTTAESLLNCSLAFAPQIDMAIINLLNNAADVSHDVIELNLYADNNFLVWDVIDSGPGISQTLTEQLGKVGVSPSGDGLGLGMLLTHTTLQHYGGRVEQFANKTTRGTTTRAYLPLSATGVN